MCTQMPMNPERSRVGDSNIYFHYISQTFCNMDNFVKNSPTLGLQAHPGKESGLARAAHSPTCPQQEAAAPRLALSWGSHVLSSPDLGHPSSPRPPTLSKAPHTRA